MKTHHNRKYQMLCPKSDLVLIKNNRDEIRRIVHERQIEVLNLNIRLENGQRVLDHLRKDLVENFQIVTNYHPDYRKFYFYTNIYTNMALYTYKL